MEARNTRNQEIVLLNTREVDKRLKEALYSANIGCPETVLYELAEASYHDELMQRISRAIWRCIRSRLMRWVRVQKALNLITYLILNGSKACYDDVVNNLETITAINNMKLPKDSTSVGRIIKEKAIYIVTLVCDTVLLDRKRKEAAELRSRIVSVSSQNGKMVTKVIHKPIYVVENKNKLQGIPAVAGTDKTSLIARAKTTGGRLQKFADRFTIRGGNYTSFSDNRPSEFCKSGTAGFRKSADFISHHSVDISAYTSSDRGGDSDSDSDGPYSTTYYTKGVTSNRGSRSRITVRSVTSSGYSSSGDYSAASSGETDSSDYKRYPSSQKKGYGRNGGVEDVPPASVIPIEDRRSERFRSKGYSARKTLMDESDHVDAGTFRLRNEISQKTDRERHYYSAIADRHRGVATPF